MRAFTEITTAFSLLLSVQTWATLPCNPIGQIVYLSGLTSKEVGFFEVYGDAPRATAELNSQSCSKAKIILSKKDYIKMQILESSARSGLILLEKTKSSGNVTCVKGIHIEEDLFTKKWRIEEDHCWMEPTNLKKMISLDGRQVFYTTAQQSRLLLSRSKSPGLKHQSTR